MQLAEPTRAGFVDLNRTRLRVWEWGDEDAPVVICVHGANDHGRLWDGMAPELAALGYRVLAPDLRGHGDSGRLGSGMMWAASALDLAALARWAGPPAGLVGHSFGGGQALYAAGVWPELFTWVVNLDGLGPPAEMFEQGDIGEAAKRSIDNADRVLFESPRVYSSLEEMAARRRQVNPRLPEEWLQHLVRHGVQPVEGGYVWKCGPMFRVGVPGPFGVEHLEAEHALVAQPVLVLTGGEHDTWSELTEAQIEARLVPLRDARHRVVPSAGHYVHLERPDFVMDAIREFLAEVRQ